MTITDAQVEAAVDAYDAARCAFHGQSIELSGMSPVNKRGISPMIRAALEAAIDPNVAKDAARWRWFRENFVWAKGMQGAYRAAMEWIFLEGEIAKIRLKQAEHIDAIADRGIAEQEGK